MDQIQFAFSFTDTPMSPASPVLSNDAQPRSEGGPSNSQNVAPRDEPAAEPCLHQPSPATEPAGAESEQVPDAGVAGLPENLRQVLAFLAADQRGRGVRCARR